MDNNHENNLNESFASRIISMLKSVEWRTKAFPRALFVLCIVSIVVFSSLIKGFNLLNTPKVALEPKMPNPFHGLQIEGRSAIVWDVVKGEVLYEKNADAVRPLASLTKIMTALTAKAATPSLREVKIKLDDLAPEGDSKLRVGSDWGISDLIDYVLLVSSNDGAHALAAGAGTLLNEERKGPELVYAEAVDGNTDEYEFVREMNKLASKIGLKRTSFTNEHGLDSGEEISGAYGSARDIALLTEYILKNYPNLLEATRYSDLAISDGDNDTYMAINTNPVINLIPSPLASKTGFTKLAGGNLLVAFDAGLGRPIIIAVLGSSQDGRFSDVLKLTDAAMKFIER